MMGYFEDLHGNGTTSEIEEKNNLAFKREELPKMLEKLSHGERLANAAGDSVTAKHIKKAMQSIREVAG